MLKVPLNPNQSVSLEDILIFSRRLCIQYSRACCCFKSI